MISRRFVFHSFRQSSSSSLCLFSSFRWKSTTFTLTKPSVTLVPPKEKTGGKISPSPSSTWQDEMLFPLLKLISIPQTENHQLRSLLFKLLDVNFHNKEEFKNQVRTVTECICCCSNKNSTRILSILLQVVMQPAADSLFHQLSHGHNGDDDASLPFFVENLLPINEQRKKFFREIIEGNNNNSSETKSFGKKNGTSSSLRSSSIDDDASLLFLSLEILSRFFSSQQQNSDHPAVVLKKLVSLVIEHAIFVEASSKRDHHATSTLFVAKIAIDLIFANNNNKNMNAGDDIILISELIENCVILGVPHFGSEILSHYAMKSNDPSFSATKVVERMMLQFDYCADANNTTNFHHLLRKSKFQRLRTKILCPDRNFDLWKNFFTFVVALQSTNCADIFLLSLIKSCEKMASCLDRGDYIDRDKIQTIRNSIDHLLNVWMDPTNRLPPLSVLIDLLSRPVIIKLCFLDGEAEDNDEARSRSNKAANAICAYINLKHNSPRQHNNNNNETTITFDEKFFQDVIKPKHEASLGKLDKFVMGLRFREHENNNFLQEERKNLLKEFCSNQ